MTEKIIFYLIITIIVGFVLNWANTKSNVKKKSDSNGITYLKMNKLYFFGGISSLLMWGLFSIFLFSSEEDDLNTFLVTFGIMSIVTIGPGIPCLLWYLNHTVMYDSEKITVKNAYGKEKTIFIKEIISSKLNIFTGLLEVKTNNEIVKIHQHLIGVGDLTKTIKT